MKRCWCCGRSVKAWDSPKYAKACPHCGMHNNMAMLREELEMTAREFKAYVVENRCETR